jgi:tetratricopeptide (TPR) repeat protein
MSVGRALIAALGLALSLSFPAALAGAPAAPAGKLPASALRTLLASQDALSELQFERAERLARQVVLGYPAHPLPRIFLQGALLARIQEKMNAQEDDAGLLTDFNRESDSAVDLALQWEAIRPGPEAKLFLGNALGARGLVKLYQGSILAAYGDGQKAAAELRAAVALDPALYEAYLGLGQYEYYCGRMNGVLRFVANLQGNAAAGIALLKQAADKGVYTATPAQAALARILSQEEVDFNAALPYLKVLRRRYPGNYYYAQYALAVAHGLGWQDPRARRLAGSVYAQWDRGWRPPSYAKLDVAGSRTEMAEAAPLRQVKELSLAERMD